MLKKKDFGVIMDVLADTGFSEMIFFFHEKLKSLTCNCLVCFVVVRIILDEGYQNIGNPCHLNLCHVVCFYVIVFQN